MQQGVDLIEFQGKPADFRVHTNKNRKGKWTVTAIAVKISGEAHLTFSFSKVLISSNFKANQRISVSIPIKTEKGNGQ
ncbi:YheC/YheD family protein [Clostridium tertium]